MSDSECDGIGRLVGDHLRWCATQRPAWLQRREAYAHRLWGDRRPTVDLLKALGGAIGEGDPLPIKMQVNLIEAWVRRQTSAMFMRNPHADVVGPAVVDATRRKIIGADVLAAVSAVCDDWLRRTEIQEMSTHAMRIALLYPGAAFKVGYDASEDHTAEPLDRVWLDVLPPWETMWDARARDMRRQRYRGHLRWETVEAASEMMDADLSGAALDQLPDYVIEGNTASSDRKGDDHYVQILEFYDLIEKTQRWFLVVDAKEGTSGPRLEEHGLTAKGTPRPIPYTWGDKRPAVPLQPVVLHNIPEHPLSALAPAVVSEEFGAERSLHQTVLANAFRRDMARVQFYDKTSGMMTPTVLGEVRNAWDRQLVGVDANGAPLDKLFADLPAAQIAPVVQAYQAWLESGYQSSQAASPLANGDQLKYASATETQALLAGDEAAASEPAARMAQALGRACELMLVILAAEAGTVSVRRGSRSLTLRKEDLFERWQVTVVDAHSTPMRQAQAQQQFAGIQSQLMELAKLASDPTTPPFVKAMAEAQMTYIGEEWNLPETMRPAALQHRAEFIAKEAEKEKPEAEEPGEAPEVGDLMGTSPAGAPQVAPTSPEVAPVPAPPGVEKLLGRLTPEEVNALLQAGG